MAEAREAGRYLPEPFLPTTHVGVEIFREKRYSHSRVSLLKASPRFLVELIFIYTML
jgi:hypothetical protein